MKNRENNTILPNNIFNIVCDVLEDKGDIKQEFLMKFSKKRQSVATALASAYTDALNTPVHTEEIEAIFDELIRDYTEDKEGKYTEGIPYTLESLGNFFQNGYKPRKSDLDHPLIIFHALEDMKDYDYDRDYRWYPSERRAAEYIEKVFKRHGLR